MLTNSSNIPVQDLNMKGHFKAVNYQITSIIEEDKSISSSSGSCKSSDDLTLHFGKEGMKKK
jgi:predicted transcriptional regulator